MPRFEFFNRQLGICALCAKRDYTYDVGSLALASRFCRKCIMKEGATNLCRDANVALERAKTRIDTARVELHDIGQRYAAKFGVSLKFDIPTAEIVRRTTRKVNP